MTDEHDAGQPGDAQQPSGQSGDRNKSADFEETCLAMLRETATRQSDLGQVVADLGGQGAFVRQQMTQVFDAVRQLYDAVSAQCRQLLQSDQALQQALQQFQTGGPQRAMAGVFHKLFRDLVGHVAEMDDLLALADGHPLSEAETPWI